ncbi:hypothetical protein A3D78_03300 [Candidatus Gottesmanbacteria bacterium RIFCSPHIGHO2_02_FULL_39_14]|uniref:Uncharacterized protein n=1 Tax=Candidatus Gottesmanbacteria bacterium RIFCSPHIGHO2_02_FULL_39_14 TaxID=1798383 RepID=A0A1F5ZTZ5_9BACT|nr:MAG: hypothetical protein A3D78_03300 [Candidatus Gottesmanbacteria bacterium RIFCSPHIGHO2_02_FULL_39_14]
MSFIKNLFIFLLIFPLIIFSAPPVYSQSATSIQTSPSAQIATQSATDLNRHYSEKLIGWVTNLHLVTCIIVGEKCFSEESLKKGAKLPVELKLDKNHDYFKNGLLGVASNLFIIPYANPPASFSFALMNKLSDVSMGGKVYAQATGLGMTSLSAYLSFWSISRNIAYSLIIIALLITGFLYIFRFKIDPNISIDIEKTILKAVLVVLTVTFSFAIAGFFIDLMYLSLMVVFQIARTNNLVDAQLVESLYGHTSPGEIFDFLTIQSNPYAFVDSFLKIIPDTVRNLIKDNLTFMLGMQIYPNVASALHDIVTFIETRFFALEFDPGALAAGGLAIPLSGWLASQIIEKLEQLVLIVAIYFALLFLYFRILFTLIGSYIEIVFGVVFAPFLLLADIFPGKNQFSKWLKRLLANIITFPLLAVLFLAGANIIKAVSSTGNAFLPPPLSGITQTVLSSFVSIGVLMAIPAIIDRIKKSIIPEYTLVNFPTTPASILGVVASIIPFLPTIAHAYSSAASGGMTKIGQIFHKPGTVNPKKPEEPPLVPHMPSEGEGKT